MHGAIAAKSANNGAEVAVIFLSDDAADDAGVDAPVVAQEPRVEAVLAAERVGEKRLANVDAHDPPAVEAGIEEDDSAVLACLADVRAFAPAAQGDSGLRLRFNDVLRTVQYMPAVRAAV